MYFAKLWVFNSQLLNSCLYLISSIPGQDGLGTCNQAKSEDNDITVEKSGSRSENVMGLW